MADAAPMGPVSYLIVEFPGNKMTGEGFPILVDLVDRGLIRILDLAFVTKDDDGTVRAIDLSDIDGDGELDLADAAPAITPGSSAGILVFENRWATEFVEALRRGDAQLVAAGYIPQDALLASLDATDH